MIRKEIGCMREREGWWYRRAYQNVHFSCVSFIVYAYNSLCMLLTALTPPHRCPKSSSTQRTWHGPADGPSVCRISATRFLGRFLDYTHMKATREILGTLDTYIQGDRRTVRRIDRRTDERNTKQLTIQVLRSERAHMGWGGLEGLPHFGRPCRRGVPWVCRPYITRPLCRLAFLMFVIISVCICMYMYICVCMYVCMYKYVCACLWCSVCVTFIL